MIFCALFEALQPEFDYGCRPPVLMHTGVAGDSKSASSLPSHPHLFVLIMFVELKIFDLSLLLCLTNVNL